MMATRSISDIMKAEYCDQNTPQSTAESRGEPVDNEVFVPLSSPLPTTSTADETQKTPVPNPTPPEKPAKVIQRRKRKTPVSTPDPNQVKKKKDPIAKPGPADSDTLDFTETKPDVATIMGFPLPKINHGGTRPSRVPRHLYTSPSLSDMDDMNAVERVFRDLLNVREVVDWESRRLGRRLWLLRKKAALEEQREDALRSKMWEQDNGSLEEDIKKLEEEKIRLSQ